jgi:hypothetical protein
MLGVRRHMQYPIVPKSTKDLLPGQFWSIPLADGRFGCGRVLQLNGDQIPTPMRSFLGGLHHWVSSSPPDVSSPLGCDFVAFGIMHIKAITKTGGFVLGQRSLESDKIEIPLLLHGTDIVRGAQSLRPAQPDEIRQLLRLGYWGFDYIQTLANEKLCVIA